MTIIYAQSITCDLPTAGNQQRRAREIAILVRDGVLVWCNACQLSHHVHKDVCLEVWGGEGPVMRRETCDKVSHRNMAGRDKLYVVVNQEGIRCWCKHCQKAHVIMKERCLEMWD